MAHLTDLEDYGREAPGYVCMDPACRERFGEHEGYEAFPCSVEDCQNSGCPTCESKCYSCDRHFCSQHWSFADCGDSVRRYCAGCVKEALENAA